MNIAPERAKAEALARFRDGKPDHINCAQAVVSFALLLRGDDPALVTTARYFGGGVAGMGEACGALTGAALALGLRDLVLVGESDDLAERTRERLQQLVCEFTIAFGGRRCLDLTGCDLSTPEGHEMFVASGARDRCPVYVDWVCDRLAPLLAPQPHKP